MPHFLFECFRKADIRLKDSPKSVGPGFVYSDVLKVIVEEDPDNILKRLPDTLVSLVNRNGISWSIKQINESKQ